MEHFVVHSNTDQSDTCIFKVSLLTQCLLCQTSQFEREQSVTIHFNFFFFFAEQCNGHDS